MKTCGYLSCHDCRQTLRLGLAQHFANHQFAFHKGGPDEPPNWARPQLNQVLWKFLADHAGHRLDVRLDHEMTREMKETISGYQQIGIDSGGHITYEEYLRGWPGLVEKPG